MIIRRADKKDTDQILDLLSEVLELHANVRPDLFVSGSTKYSEEELMDIIYDDNRPIFVAAEDDKVLGYVFCEVKYQPESRFMKSFKYLYIDDLCVEQSERGKRIGQKLFEFAKEYARQIGCFEITLNVWEGNDVAKEFYEKMGMKVKKNNMELVFD